MQELYSLLTEAEMLVIASPIYYFGLTGQLQCAIHRTYAVGIPSRLKKAALILSSGSDDVYEGAIYEYKQIVEYMKLEDLGICTAHGCENKSEKKLAELRAWGQKI
jgi:multimeric flavodoxin WrbA